LALTRLPWRLDTTLLKSCGSMSQPWSSSPLRIRRISSNFLRFRSPSGRLIWCVDVQPVYVVVLYFFLSHYLIDTPGKKTCDGPYRYDHNYPASSSHCGSSCFINSLNLGEIAVIMVRKIKMTAMSPTLKSATGFAGFPSPPMRSVT